MAHLRFLGPAAAAAGTAHDDIDARTVDEVVSVLAARYGPSLAALLPTCCIRVNGEEADGTRNLGAHDEVAVLPPMSGG
ncbi:MAG TPA: MoaD/ThiS family protein [Acidimicrobiales bacterium]|nr:MoaD/ThiS family protein [Acidimicrobiales bacterium]